MRPGSRFVTALVQTQGISNVHRMFEVARHDGADFNVAYIGVTGISSSSGGIYAVGGGAPGAAGGGGVTNREGESDEDSGTWTGSSMRFC